MIDPSIIATPEAEKAKAACKYNAVDLGMKEETMTIKAGAVIWATGWKPYDAAKIQPYGYDRYANVITSVEFERGPIRAHRRQAGAPLGRQRGQERRLIRCAGSRDRNQLKHCSQPVRHMVEVLIEDFGYDELAKPVKKPLEGIKIAGYVAARRTAPLASPANPSRTRNTSTSWSRQWAARRSRSTTRR
jgi:hypothetical protein